MVKKTILVIAIPIVLFLIYYFSMYFINYSKIVGWFDFKNEIMNEFTNIKGISVTNPTNPTVYIIFRLKKPYEKEDAKAIFLRVIEFLSNKESYNSLQDLHKERFKYSAFRIKISFQYKNGNNSILCSFETSSETSGDDFTLDSFKNWGQFYQGEFIETYELP